MKVVKTAVLRHKDSSLQKLACVQVESTVFRWLMEAGMEPYDGVDYLSEHDAIKGLRVAVETDWKLVGVDLTIYPVEPTPAERAAKGTLHYLDDLISVCEIGPPEAILAESIAQIIEQETAIGRMVEAVNLLIAYEFPRLRHPKRAGLDMTHGGLILGVIEAIEVATKADLSNLKKSLTEGVEQVRVYSSVPQKNTNVN